MAFFQFTPQRTRGQRSGDTSRGLSGRNYVPRKYPGTPENFSTLVILSYE